MTATTTPQVTIARTADILGREVRVNGQMAGHVRRRGDKAGWLAVLPGGTQVHPCARSREYAAEKLAAAWMCGHR